jgi:nanoRNase/pAp phosphatase (c-di-AMP/oligoRNAs hydrolase)
MTAFVESCVETVAGSAVAAARHARKQPRAAKLLRVLAGKKNILVTTHIHPDPDALASAVGMCKLLNVKLKDANVTMSIKGRLGGGLNEAFVKFSALEPAPWNDEKLKEYDAIILLDTQPSFAFSPLPQSVQATAVIDHHPARGRRPKCPFCDVRSDTGATSSIIFSYFMELEVPIPPDLGATLLYAIESDLAGAAGMPGTLDNLALSTLTLVADTRKLYQMRYVDLQQSYFKAYADGLATAVYYGNMMLAHIDEIDTLEKPAVIADFLLRFDQVQWALVSGVHDKRLMLSLRTGTTKQSAGEIMRRLIRNIGEGGGHRTKAGGFIPLETGSAAEIERHRATLRRRLLRALNIDPSARGQRLVPRNEAAPAKPAKPMTTTKALSETQPSA